MFHAELVKPAKEFTRIGITQSEENQVYLTYLDEFTESEKKLVEEVATVAQYSRTGFIISLLEVEMDKYEPMSEEFDALGDAISLIIETLRPKDKTDEVSEESN